MLVPLEPSNDPQIAESIPACQGAVLPGTFEDLYRLYGERLLRYLAAQGLVRQEREDVAGEAWTRAWQGLSRYEYREHVGFFPWLRKIADNVNHEFTRKRYFARGEDVPSLDEESVADPLATNEALIHLTRTEIRQAIVDVLPDVPNADWRIAIEAHLIDGWQTDEIMELYGWSRSKVDVTKFRAFRWLRARLLELIGPTDIEAWLADP